MIGAAHMLDRLSAESHAAKAFTHSKASYLHPYAPSLHLFNLRDPFGKMQGEMHHDVLQAHRYHEVSYRRSLALQRYRMQGAADIGQPLTICANGAAASSPHTGRIGVTLWSSFPGASNSNSPAGLWNIHGVHSFQFSHRCCLLHRAHQPFLYLNSVLPSVAQRRRPSPDADATRYLDVVSKSAPFPSHSSRKGVSSSVRAVDSHRKGCIPHGAISIHTLLLYMLVSR